MPLLSVVVPCRNEEESLPCFLDEMAGVIDELEGGASGLEVELLLVDDGSSDRTLSVIKEQVSQRPFAISWVSFSRNFGKEAAIFAGIEHAQGDYVALIDADMQDPPSLLLTMWDAVGSGTCDMAVARRTDREGEAFVRSAASRAFYRIFRRLTHIDVADGERDYRLMNRAVANALLSLGEQNRFSKGLFKWLGYRVTYVDYKNENRKAGSSKWSIGQLMRYAIDGISSFSSAPLSSASIVGLVFCILAVLFLLFIVVRAALFGDRVAGWPSLASIVVLLGGLQLFYLGLIGQYIAKTYMETKERPLYIVSDTNIMGHQ